MKNASSIKKSYQTLLLSIVLLSMLSCTILVSGAQQTNTTTLRTQEDDDVVIVLRTDQPVYFPGDWVIISGRVKVNGTGVETSICYAVYDPNGSLYSGGVCGMTDENGFFIQFCILGLDAPLGTYTVKVDAEEYGKNATITFEVVTSTVTALPGGPYGGAAGKPIHLNGHAIGGKPPYTWLWEFGDGTNATGQTPTHSYQNPGNYTVTLTVWDNEFNKGINTTTATVTETPAELKITGTRGLIGIKATIKNIGTTPSQDVDWSITITGDAIFFPQTNQTTGTIESINAGEQTELSYFLFGYGPIQITITASTIGSSDTVTASGFLLGPFIRYNW